MNIILLIALILIIAAETTLNGIFRIMANLIGIFLTFGIIWGALQVGPESNDGVRLLCGAFFLFGLALGALMALWRRYAENLYRLNKPDS